MEAMIEVVEGCVDTRLAEIIVELRDLKEEVAAGRHEKTVIG